MKVYNEHKITNLHPEINEEILKYRALKKFDPLDYINKKTKYLNKYMQKCGLKSCIVAVSGGIDSAAVLGLVHAASLEKNSPIQEIMPIMLPDFKSQGVTNQDKATLRGKHLCNQWGLNGFIMDVDKVVKDIKECSENTLGIKSDAWGEGQLVPYTRTPFLYFAATLSNVAGLPGIICGTTNRDEGAYLGYVGKASDGMVDIQLISDLHKSEVYRVAKTLEITQEILEATPTGDMYDYRDDTEVFGAPYDFVELYLYYLRKSDKDREVILNSFSSEAREEFQQLQRNLEKLHKYNRHKYISRSPAVHLDLWDSSCPDGWINYYEITKRFMEE